MQVTGVKQGNTTHVTVCAAKEIRNFLDRNFLKIPWVGATAPRQMKSARHDTAAG